MRLFILHIIAICISFGAIGQRKKVELSVTPDEVSVGQNVNITIKSNMEGELVENLPAAFVKGYGVNSYSQYIQDVTTGDMIQEHIIVINGAFSKAGTFTIGPFYVKDGNKSKKSNTVSVKVTNGAVISTEDFSKDQLKKPAFGIIERSSEEVYEGQALVLNARVYSKFSPTGQPLLKRNYEVRGIVESHDLGLSGKNYIESVAIKGKEYSTFSYDKRLIFPTTIGVLDILPYNIMLPYDQQGYDIQSNVPKIKVIPLPAGAPKDFIGGVGKFSVSQKIDTKKLKQGEVFTLDVTISGEGNLHNLDKPKLPLTNGMVVYGDPILTEEYTFGSKGATGSITYSYNVQVTKAGIQHVPSVAISYFDPFLKKYVSIDADSSSTIDVKANPKFEVTNKEELATQTIDMTVDNCAPLMKFETSSNVKTLNTSLLWAGIISPLALAFLVLFILKKREKGADLKEITTKVNAIKLDSKNYLIDAKQHLSTGNNDAFYSSLEKGISKMCIAIAHLDETMIYSRFELIEGLKSKGISAEVIHQITSLFEECDNARYGIQGDSVAKESMLKTLENIQKGLIG